MAKKKKKRAARKAGALSGGTKFLLFLILLTAVILRLYQPDWYNDRQFHPDERWIISNAVPQLHYPDKPIGLQYGSLPLYIMAAHKDLMDWVREKVNPRMDMNKAKIGGARAISGLFDTGTIVMIFMTGLMLFGPRAALLAAMLLAFTTLHIHASHFLTVDTFVTFFISVTVYFCARIYRRGGIMNYVWAGVFFAAALASKTAAAPLAAVILTAHLMNFFSIKGANRAAAEARRDSWINLGITVAVTAIAFFAFMPYAILDFNKFMNDQNYQRRILVTGEGDVPYNRQYLHTTPYLYYMKNLVLYTMGIPYGVTALAAFGFYIFMLFYNFRRRKPLDRDMLLLLSWMVPYFLIVGSSFGKFNRYMLPLTPFLALLTAKFIYDLYGYIKDRRIVAAIKYAVVLGAMFYGLAFMNVYRNNHTWVEASRWFYKNVPQVNAETGRQTVVLNEMWGDDLPVYADGQHIGLYQNLKWNLQEPDSPRKVDELAGMLSRTDYVMMADKRAYGTYMRIPERYPINYFYYSTMMKEPEKLGFRLAHEQATYPSLFGIRIKDDAADESFQLYDHPHVYIFKNEKYMDAQTLKGIILGGEAEIKARFGSKAGGANPNIGQYRDMVNSVMPALSVFMWYVLVQVLAFILWPLHHYVLPNLRDKGYGLSKVTGVFVFAYLNWMLVSLNAWKFYQMNLWILLAAMAAAAIWWYRKNSAAVSEFASSNRRNILVNEAVFLGAYMFFILIKLYCPDIHNVAGHGYNGGGEPMGMAYLSGIFNDVKFPPHDPWLSGYTLNYYYWGQLLLATLSKMLGYLPRITYNLSLALLFALCFASAFSLSYNLTGKYRYGLFGGFLLAMAGNFHTFVYTADAAINAGNLQQFFNSFFRFEFIWNPTRLYPHPAITEVPFFSYLYGDLHAHNIVIPFTVLLAAVVYNIMKNRNEGLNAYNSFGPDGLSRGLTAGMLSLLLGSMLAINTWNFPPVFVLIGLAFFISGLYLLALNYRPGRKDGAAGLIRASVPSLGLFLLMAAIVLAAAYLFFMPFHANFSVPYKSSAKLISKAERAPLPVMFAYFSIFFFGVSAYLGRFITGGAESFGSGVRPVRMRGFDIDKVFAYFGRVFDNIFDRPGLTVKFTASAVILAVSAALSIFVQDTFGVLFLMSAAAAWALLKTDDTDERFSLLLLFVSLCVIFGTEIFFVADGRMNTVFKFYMVVWTLLSLCVPYLVYRALRGYQKAFKKRPGDAWITAGAAVALIALFYFVKRYDARAGGKLFGPAFVALLILGPVFIHILRDRAGRIVFASVMAFVMIPAAFYPLMGSFIKMSICSQGFSQKPRIDGMAYMASQEQRPGSTYDFDKYDYHAIDWISGNFRKIEPVVEAPGEHMYRGMSRISIFTGMPTLAGWGYQVSQQSGRGDKVNEATRDAAFIYNTPDMEQALHFMRKYGARWLYAGNIEKRNYQGVYKFGLAASPVFRTGQSELYLFDIK